MRNNFFMESENRIDSFLTDLFSLKESILLADLIAASNHYYYENGKPLGAGGDFITAPEISQLFGECIALWCLFQSQRCNTKTPHIVELGPGKGTLMSDMVRVFRSQPSFNPTLHLVETSFSLQHYQYELLKNCGYSLHHHTVFPNIDEPIIIIANEFFDALPMQQYIWKDNIWHEVYITNQENKYIYDLRPIDDCNSLNSDFLSQKSFFDFEVLFEYSEASLSFANLIAKSIKKSGGGALIIDYGDFTPYDRFGDTFQAVYRHKYVNPLTHLGKADLTHHVDFARLVYAFQHYDLTCHFSTQCEFLKVNGFDCRLDQLLKNCVTTTQKKDLLSRAERLIQQNEMGTLFKVLEVSNI